MKESNNNVFHLPGPPAICPSCGSTDISSSNEEEEFPFRHGQERVMLAALVPVQTCRACGTSFTDYRGEDAREQAIARYLGILRPKELIAIREQLGLSREKFAELTGIGGASIARWESGRSRQNKALDNLVYLSSFADNVSRLRLRHTETPSPARAGQRGAGMRHLKVDADKTREADSFQLHPGRACTR
jgi:putative zinc finger/helix-turn-helix YgiT family protein